MKLNKMKAKVFLILLTLVLGIPLGSYTQASADGNASLGPSFNLTIQGDVVSAGVGLRGTGTGNISLSTLPDDATVQKAFLYWATLGNAGTFVSPTFAGLAIQGNLIGTAGDTCWAVEGNFVYRADVTELVTGNGVYAISGLPGSLAEGNDSQGASLVVIFSHPSHPVRTIVIHDGAVALDLSEHAYTDTISGFTPDAPLTQAHITYLVGDGQIEWEAGNVSVNGTPIAAGIFTGVDGDFWGTHTFDVTSLVTDAPVTTTINNNDPGNPESPECLLWAATILSVTTEDIYQSANQLEAFQSVTLYGDVTAAGVGLRGSGAGEIELTGIPAGAGVRNAYLYWATLGNSGTFVSPSLEGTQVAGELVGISADTCWGVPHNFVYRADVTSLVRGNGSYTISGLPDDLRAGNDSQGASLVVIYQLSGLYRTIIINDGAVTLDLSVHEYMDTIGPFTADQPEAETHITYLVGDGQEQWDSGNVNFEGSQVASGIFTGQDGEQWGTVNLDVTGLVTEPEATTTINNNRSGPGSPDCLLWAATVLSVQTEQPVITDILYFPVLSAVE